MTDNINKLMAEALVECGYATEYQSWLKISQFEVVVNGRFENVEPFADTLEGRRQADALEDYFEQRPDLWDLWNSYSRPYIYDVGESMREWRLDRTKYCFEQLAEKS